MMPGLGGMNPKKMASMMKQLGINQEEIEATRVIIEREAGNIIIDNPSVTRIDMKGNESWQIVGDAREEETGIAQEDISLVAEKTGKSEEEAKKALEETGDIAEAIMKLNE